MRIIFRVCERIQVLDYGKSIAVGSPEEIRTDPAVITAYLGEKGAEIAQAG
jgi:branched-chain amino acid transport system ATP-binding protein